jgi:hypothetical protein
MVLLTSSSFSEHLRDRKELKSSSTDHTSPTHCPQVCLRLLPCACCLGIGSAFSIIYQHRSRKLFFARDPLGRRSLLVQWPTDELQHLLLTSVSIGTNKGYELTELSTEHIYALDLNGLNGNLITSLDVCLECLPRLTPSDDSSARLAFVRVLLLTCPTFNREALCVHRHDLKG